MTSFSVLQTISLTSLKIYTTLGYIVSLILLNLGRVSLSHRQPYVSHTAHTADDAKAKHVSQIQED